MFRISLLSLAAFAAFTCIASGQTLEPNVPSNLRVPRGHTAFLKARASGTQNYVCMPAGAGLAWKFQGPQATLFYVYRWMQHEIQQQIATHFLSPNPMEAGAPARAAWQSSVDTSAVWARKVQESSDPVYVAQGAIPWFLLETMGTQAGPAGGTFLARTTYLQRVNTTGGTMPATACTEPGQIAFVPYTADYIFYRAE